MNPYHKIKTVLKRDPETNHKTLLREFTTPEFEYLKDNNWTFTEKVDGENIRVMSLPSGDVAFSGRTNNAHLPAPLMARLCDLFPCRGKLFNQFPNGGCLYGEGYGAKIRKGGGNYSPTQEFVLFDVRVGDWWLNRFAVQEIAENLKIEAVPIVGHGTLSDMISRVRSGDLDSAWGGFAAEGIVARPAVEFFGRNGDRIITKLKVKDFH